MKITDHRSEMKSHMSEKKNVKQKCEENTFDL